MREVVTVQVSGFGNFVGGHFWNFVGNHFWNFQVIHWFIPPPPPNVPHILSFEAFRTGILHLQGLDLTPPLHFPLCSAWVLQDELLGLANDPNADSVFRTAALDMDVLYRTGETHHVEALTRCFCPKTPSFSL
jgi:hypothetical protein